MSAKSTYISERVLRELPPTLRHQLYKVLGGRAAVVRRYACNVFADLQARGEHELAWELEAELTDRNFLGCMPETVR